MSELMMIFVLIFLVLVGGLFFVIKSTKRREGKWGINLKDVTCPSCGVELPKYRKPASLKETLWGGWTCGTCGYSCDKWGKARKNTDENDGADIQENTGTTNNSASTMND